MSAVANAGAAEFEFWCCYETYMLFPSFFLHCAISFILFLLSFLSFRFSSGTLP